MHHRYAFEIGRHEVIADIDIDVEPPDRSVGYNEPAYDITCVTVRQFGEHDRTQAGDDVNWITLDRFIERLFDRDYDERWRMLESACEEAAENYYARRY